MSLKFNLNQSWNRRELELYFPLLLSFFSVKETQRHWEKTNFREHNLSPSTRIFTLHPLPVLFSRELRASAVCFSIHPTCRPQSPISANMGKGNVNKLNFCVFQFNLVSQTATTFFFLPKPSHKIGQGYLSPILNKFKLQYLLFCGKCILWRMSKYLDLKSMLIDIFPI